MDMPHTKAIHDATRIPFSIARPIMISPMLISPSSMNSVVLTDTPVSIWKSNSSIPQCCIGAMPCLASRKFTQTNSNGAMKCQVATTPITVAIQKRRTHRAAMNSVAIEATGQRFPLPRPSKMAKQRPLGPWLRIESIPKRDSDPHN